MLRLTFTRSPSILTGKPRPPEMVLTGGDAEELLDKWNASGYYSAYDPVAFREFVAGMGGLELPAADDDLLEAAVKASKGGIVLDEPDTVASRIFATR